jgi:SAM-dependent methyltransferase
MNLNKVAYDAVVANSYDADREVEDHWVKENEFVRKYFESQSAANILDLPVGTGRFLPFYPVQSNVKLNDAKAENISLRIADVASLDLVETASVDVIVCFRLMHLLRGGKRLGAFKEFGRVLRGELLLQLYISAPRKPFVLRSLSRVKGWVRRQLDIDRSACKPWSHIESYTFSEQDIVEGCLAGNLKVVSRTHLCNYYGQEVSVLTFRKS